jgi:hypothetical protein
MAITEATQRRDFSPTPEPFTPVASKRKRSEWKPTKILLNQLKFIGPGIVAASVLSTIQTLNTHPLKLTHF